MNRRRLPATALMIVALGCASLPLVAQGRPPAKATVTAFVETPRVAAGGELHAALRIKLPDGFHTNSNKPRDPSLIPIAVTLAAEAPAAVTIEELVYPAATELKQRG